MPDESTPATEPSKPPRRHGVIIEMHEPQSPAPGFATPYPDSVGWGLSMYPADDGESEPTSAPPSSPAAPRPPRSAPPIPTAKELSANLAKYLEEHPDEFREEVVSKATGIDHLQYRADWRQHLTAVLDRQAKQLQEAAESNKTTPTSKQDRPKVTAVDRALILLTKKKYRSRRELADEVGCDPSVFSRSEAFKRMWNACNGSIPKGSKKDGNMEARFDDDDVDD